MPKLCKKIYPRLEMEITNRGYTTRQMAFALHCDVSTINCWRRGMTAIRLEAARAMRNRLFPDMSMDELFKTAEEMSKQEIKEN